MVERHLQDERWIFWVDADIIDYPPLLIEQLIQRAEGGIAAPLVLMEGEITDPSTKMDSAQDGFTILLDSLKMGAGPASRRRSSISPGQSIAWIPLVAVIWSTQIYTAMEPGTSSITPRPPLSPRTAFGKKTPFVKTSTAQPIRLVIITACVSLPANPNCLSGRSPI